MSLEKVRLSNGLTVYNDRIPGARTNKVNVFVPYGSVDEAPGDEGVAHVFEHCVHLQTDDFEDRSALKKFATKNGMVTNANTYYTRTLYYANSRELEPNMQHLSQILQHTHFPEESVEHELKAVRREMTTRLDSPAEPHALAVSNAMFGLPYGRSVGGYHDKIDFDVDTLKKLHERYYKLGNMALVVSGGHTTEQVVDMANRYFEADKEFTVVSPAELSVELGKHHRTGLVREDSRNVRLAYSYPMTAEYRDEFNSDRIAYSAALSAMGQKCFEMLRYDKGISYDGGVSSSTYNHPNAWRVYGSVTTDADKVPVALDVFKDIFARQSDKYDEEDLAGVLETLKYSYDDIYMDTDARVSNVISRLESYRETEDMRSIVRRLNKVKVQDVRQAIDKITNYVGAQEPYIHLTGQRQDIGEVDRIIMSHEIQ